MGLEAAMEQLEVAKQDAEVANQTKSEFLANMSHEIRTPMTAILGFSETLLEPDLSDADRLGAIHTIRRNGDFLLELINGILDLSKIEAGKLDTELIPCSPAQVVRDVISLMRIRADAKGLALATEYDGAIPEAILSDPTRLRQILINLAGNAVKFTETGDVRLVTRFIENENAPSLMQFEVIDTGIGMNGDQIGKLFRPFTQADSSTTRNFGGTGLGLAISKRLAESLGGDITVESEPGRGSVFSLTISAPPAENAARTEVPRSAGSGRTKVLEQMSGTFSGHVLLAEDGADNQRLIAYFLRKAGARVTIVENGRLAVDAAMDASEAGRPFDVILMDMQMPEMDGYEATRRLRAREYNGAIIALTAHAMAEDRARCLDAGCDDFATKPIDRKELLRVIQQQVESGGIPAGASCSRDGEAHRPGGANDGGRT